ncbi:MAG TPA: magnesium transporter [Rhodospirillaceae bacterium]|jgi:magnesium transporter|nr:magnesium transporter [Rhodospirillaceae bacterium]HIJ45315.1 magnesium transporter [Rhodospirillaceae bacterium]HIJ94064.1 magnesium transporter [Rhodospirillaceae bacterium]
MGNGMARDPARQTEKRDAKANAAEKAVYELAGEIEKDIVEALAEGDFGRVKDFVGSLHYADAADLLERLSPEERHLLVEVIRADFDPEILSELDDAVRDGIIEQLGIEEAAAAVAELDSDDAVQIIEELDEDEQKQLLEAIPAGDRTLIEASLAYPEDSAGRLMQRELVAVPTYWTVGETIDFMRRSAERADDAMPDIFYDIFVVDPTHKPVGSIPLSRLLRTTRPVPVTDILESEMKLIPAVMDQEEVAFLFRRRDLVSAPVVDDGGRLVGAITVDDVVDVIDEEHEEDIMRLGGVSEDDLYDAAVKTTRSRFSWLLVNLCTAILASVVIGYFEGTIDQIVALAILMPIVASMGGNAGTQTMTVAVRALAMKELTPTNAMRVIGKELLVGGINGVLFALLTGAVAWFWFGDAIIGLVIALAMIINLVVAGLAGTTIPLMLERSGIDPAVASSVLLTAITDIVGFAAFLGLAAWIIL